MSTTADYIAAAWQAAPRFALEPADITLLSHSENVVCAVELADGRRVALRIHRVGYNSFNELQSEVQWVASLGNFGVPVPAALATPEGDHYVSVPIAGVVHHVGVVDWVGGQPLGGPTQAQGPDVVDHYGKIGAVAAKIRAHHEHWVAPTNFERRSWDLEGVVGSRPLWGRFWEVEALSEAQRAVFTRCRVALASDLDQLPRSSDRFGLIHADLHLGNLMADGESLTVIDFDDAGYGWFAHELAVALHPVLDEPWEHEARDALLRGYRKIHDLSDDEEASIDTFLTLRSLMIIGWLAARSELPIFEHFADLADQAERAAHRYLDRG